MKMPSVLKTRRAVYMALAAAVVALAIPVSFALAGNGSVVTVPLQKNTYNCGLGPTIRRLERSPSLATRPET